MDLSEKYKDFEKITEDGGVLKKSSFIPDEKSYPDKGMMLKVHYEGITESDQHIFDSSYERGEPIEFRLGQKDVIDGWDQAFGHMCTGEKATLIIAPEYAYGELGMNPKIKPNAVLKFNVELVSFSEKEKRKDEMTNAERINLAGTLKQNGNDQFKSQVYDKAYEFYKRGANLLEDMFNLNDDEEQKRNELIVQVNSNLANSCLKVKKYSEAVKACDVALKNNVSGKLFYRRGLANKSLHDYDAAIKDLKRANELESEDPVIKKELQTIIDMKKKKKAKEASTYGKMFDEGKLYVDKRATNPFEEKSFPVHDDKNPVVFFEIVAGTGPARRVNIELYADRVPKTAENFFKLVTGEDGIGKSGKRLWYKDSIFHRVIKGFMMQGGDITNGDGTGGDSIYGLQFDDEWLGGRHDRQGIVSMANAGPDTQSSQFFICFEPAPHLDGKHAVVGIVLDGWEVIKEVECLECDSNDKPLKDVIIVNVGVSRYGSFEKFNYDQAFKKY